MCAMPNSSAITRARGCCERACPAGERRRLGHASVKAGKPGHLVVFQELPVTLDRLSRYAVLASGGRRRGGGNLPGARLSSVARKVGNYRRAGVSDDHAARQEGFSGHSLRAGHHPSGRSAERCDEPRNPAAAATQVVHDDERLHPGGAAVQGKFGKLCPAVVIRHERRRLPQRIETFGLIDNRQIVIEGEQLTARKLAIRTPFSLTLAAKNPSKKNPLARTTLGGFRSVEIQASQGICSREFFWQAQSKLQGRAARRLSVAKLVPQTPGCP